MDANYVFTDKNYLVKYLYTRLSNPTQIKVQKTLYLLYAFYGATYGKIKDNSEESDFEGQEYPKELFPANFEAWRYGPVEVDVYNSEKLGEYKNSSDTELDNGTPEMKNIIEFTNNIVEQTDSIDDFGLVDRTHQDDCWLDLYREGILHIKMINDDIIEEYAQKYVV